MENKKYKIKEAIIVEGVYDKIKLTSFIDGLILTTGGFSVYRSDALTQTIRSLAHSVGVVILTDSDSAGFRIRSYVKQAADGGRVLHAYIPDIRGRERRKRTPGKEGLLGVEGMSGDVILAALRRAGCTIDGCDPARIQGEKITKADLFAAGLAGGANSASTRRALALKLNIPSKISSNMLIEALNRLISREEFFAMIQNLQTEGNINEKN